MNLSNTDFLTLAEGGTLPPEKMAALRADPDALARLRETIAAVDSLHMLGLDEPLATARSPVPRRERKAKLLRALESAVWLRELGQFERAFARLTEILARAPSRQVRFKCLVEVARLEREKGLFGPAAASFRTLLKQKRLHVAERIACHNNLAWLAAKVSDFAIARQHVQAAEACIEAAQNPAPLPGSAETMHRRACLLWREGRLVEALKLIDQVIVIRRQIDGPKQLDVARSMLMKSNILESLTRLDESRVLREQVLLIRTSVLDPNHADVADVRYRLGDIYRLLGRDQDAKAAYKLARAAFRACATMKGSVGVARCHARLAEALAKQQKLHKARELALRAVPTLRRNPGIDPEARKVAEDLVHRRQRIPLPTDKRTG